jgi:hypothetical protein
MPIQAQTIANALVEEVSRLNGTTPFFIGLDNMEWRRLVREAGKLRAADAHAGWALLGMLHAMVGDVEQMDQAYQNSLDLRIDQTTIANWTANLINLGYFSRAQDLFSQHGHPNKGMFSYLYELGVMSFAYQTAADYMALAKGMNMKLEAVETPMATTISDFLRAQEISDSQVARHFDVAGEILRKRGIVFTYETNITRMEGLHYGITIAVDVPVTQSEAFDMNIELAMAEDEYEIKKHPSFDLVFSAQ